ncbi:IS3 family transposase [Rhodococcus aetherivorans]|nr:IS3 family transposase [Rhodococcus aetherivorans]
MTAGCAQAESYWATLKVEFYNRFLWPTKQHAGVAVGDWIERVGNRRRRHSAIGMISPVEFEQQFTRAAEAACPCVRWTGSTPGNRSP